MILGNASWGFRETPLEEQLKITKEMGLAVLELGIANAPNDLHLEASEEEIENVRNLYAKYGIELLCAATGNDFTNGSREDVVKMKKVINLCEALGIKILRIFAGFSPVDEVSSERWECMVSCLNELADYNENVILAVETHGGVNCYEDGVEHFHSVSTKPEVLSQMLGELSDKIMFNFDPANLWAVGIEYPEEIYKILKERVAMVHLKDFVTLPSGHLKPSACGEGQMNWGNIYRVLNRKLPWLFEYENVEDIENGLKLCLEFTRKFTEL